jgi:hypothetical protein
MFQLGQPDSQRPVRLTQLRPLRSHRGDLYILSGNPSVPDGNLVRLHADEHDRLIARHLFRGGHRKIKLHPRRDSHEQSASG